MSHSLQPHGLQHFSLLCRPLSPGVCSDSCPLNWWCYLTILSSTIPLRLCLQSFPASSSFPMSLPFGQSIGAFPMSLPFGQSIGASAAVLPVNIQGWFPSGLIGLISLQFKGLLRAPQFESINSSVLSLLYCPNLTSIRDFWENHSFDYMDLCQTGVILSANLFAILSTNFSTPLEPWGVIDLNPNKWKSI